MEVEVEFPIIASMGDIAFLGIVGVEVVGSEDEAIEDAGIRVGIITELSVSWSLLPLEIDRTGGGKDCRGLESVGLDAFILCVDSLNRMAPIRGTMATRT